MTEGAAVNFCSEECCLVSFLCICLAVQSCGLWFHGHEHCFGVLAAEDCETG